ncbi:hypothetical protein FRC07_002635 [Ceratobasidium sp. 392]|nr:hypothetical protein FRC07_002635 [Ceratobasidium sp. 392]
MELSWGRLQRQHSDPPDLFRTSTGLVCIDPVLTTGRARQILDCIHRERDRFLRVRMSKISSWAQWPFLLYAMWAQTRNKYVALNPGVGLRVNLTSTLKIRLKLQNIFYRFAIVKAENTGEALLLEFIITDIAMNLTRMDVPPAPIDSSDRQEITKAYINRLSYDPDPPRMELSLVFFGWAVLTLDAAQAGLVAAFFKTTFNYLWVAMEGMKNREPVKYIQVYHGMLYAIEVLDYFGALLGGNTYKQLKAAKDISKVLKHVSFECDLISLLARVLMFPTLSREFETLSDADKGMFSLLLS